MPVFSLKATETTLDSVVGADTLTNTYRYYGADFLLGRTGEPLRDGVFSSELSLAVGGGVAERERNYSRSDVEFTTGVHAPLWSHQAVHLRLRDGVPQHSGIDAGECRNVSCRRIWVGPRVS